MRPAVEREQFIGVAAWAALEFVSI